MQDYAELKELRNIRDFLAGVSPLETEDDLPPPPSATTLRQYFIQRVGRLEATGALEPGVLTLPEPLVPGPSAVVISSAHFTITYDTTGPNQVTAMIANDALSDLEAGLSAFYGYFVWGTINMTQVHFDSTGPHYTDPVTGIHFNASDFMARENNPAARTAITVHEDFHVWQFARGWRLQNPVDGPIYWVLEGTACWAALKWTAATPSLANPDQLTYWFDHQSQLQLAGVNKAAKGYVTLPFWMWIEGLYPNAMRSFLAGGPPAAGSVVDALARAMDGGKTFEQLVCEFGGALITNNWCPWTYRTIQSVEQPITTTIAIPVFSPSLDPNYTDELTGQGSTWTSGSPLSAGRLYFFRAQFRLTNQNPSKSWQAVVAINTLTGDGSVTAYYAAGTAPTTARSQYTVPVSLPYGNPAATDVYIVSCGNQHPPNLKFQLGFTASFVGT